MTTFQIVQVRYSNGSLIEDAWCVLYETAAKAMQDFNPTRMFGDDGTDDADYFLRELNRNYTATGNTVELTK